MYIGPFVSPIYARDVAAGKPIRRSNCGEGSGSIPMRCFDGQIPRTSYLGGVALMPDHSQHSAPVMHTFFHGNE